MIQVNFDKGNGLVPVIVQDVHSRAVLMLAYMNEESLRMTIDTGRATYYSRSRQELWIKGETAGMSGMAGCSHLLHQKENRILITINADILHILVMPACFSFDP